MTPYAIHGATLVDQGYAAIPCQPGSKMPGMCTFGEWYPAPAWNKYADRLPTSYETEAWEKWPDAGVCVVMDHHLKVVDIDTDDADIVAAIMSVLPPTTVAKKGNKGVSLFYRGSPAIAARSFNLGKTRVVDLLAYGKQTVVPPTIHPDTARPYLWIGESDLAKTAPEDLPELQDDIVDQLTAALEPFGYTAPVERDPIQGDADTAWREVNNLALARLDSWVPDLGLPRCKRAPQGGYRAVAIYRPSGSGKPTHKRNLHLAIHHDGIVDFGDNDTTFTPISLVMAVSRCNFGDAFDWLRDRLGLSAKLVDVTAMIRNGLAKQGHREVTTAELDAHVAAPAPRTVVAQGEPTPPPTEEGDAPAQVGLPLHLARSTGLVGEITQWIVDSARNPSPTLALGAALSYVGALAGRRYEGPTGLRTNVYVIGLAASGFGKDHPRVAVKSLAAKSVTLDKFFGGEGIASSSGLRNRVKKSPTLVYMLDEFGGFLRKITNTRGNNSEREIGDDLLKFTGAANSIFLGNDYAQNLAEPIYNPNVCIYGTSTPETFWSAMGSGNIADGFLPRMVVLDAGKVRPKARDALVSVDAPPQSLIDKVRALVEQKGPGGAMNGMTANGTTACKPQVAPWYGDAKAVFDRFSAEMMDAMDSGAPEYEPIYARAAENALRLALIVAVGIDPVDPVIDADVMEWARDVARCSCAMLIDQAEDRVADNERQAEYKKVRAIIASTKRKGMTRNEVARRLKGVMDRRRMGDVIDQLIEAGEIEQVTVTPPKGGTRTQRLWGMGMAPPAAPAAPETP